MTKHRALYFKYFIFSERWKYLFFFTFLQEYINVFFTFLQEYSVQITFRQQWNDNRLAFNDMNGKMLPHTDQKKKKMLPLFFGRVAGESVEEVKIFFFFVVLKPARHRLYFFAYDTVRKSHFLDVSNLNM